MSKQQSEDDRRAAFEEEEMIRLAIEASKNEEEKRVSILKLQPNENSISQVSNEIEAVTAKLN